ncbi:MAG: hypothetical protein LBK05_07510 [Treponema sp.]|jgi:hypothetical protein|nr:hypothetical protein [Treponema sp.]
MGYNKKTMKINSVSRLFCLGAVLAAASFCSCSGRIDGSIRQDGSSAGAELALEVSLQPRMAALIGNLARTLGNAAPGKPVIDGPAIARSLAAAPGVSAAALENTGPAAVRGTMRIGSLDEFLAVPGRSGSGGAAAGNLPLLRYDPAGTLLIHLDRGTGPLVLSLLSEEVNAYLSALLAPVATGESLTRAEYLGLVATIYGRPIADEIASATVEVSLEAPRAVTFIRGGSARGRTARFSLSLPELLVLEQPIDYEISWK